MERFAILAGVDHCWLDDDALLYAEADCERLADALCTRRYGFRRKNIVILKTAGASPALRPFRSNLLYGQLRQLADGAELDLLFFYFSGHAFDTGGNTYLVPADGLPSRLDTCVRLQDLLDVILEVPAKHRLVVFDACRSAHTGPATPLPQSFEDQIETAEGITVFSACSVGESSHEDPTLKAGVYTHFLIEALNGELEPDESGRVSAFRMHEYADSRVVAWANGCGQQQKPRAFIGNSSPTVYLYPRGASKRVLPAYVDDRASRTEKIIAILRDVDKEVIENRRYEVRILARMSSFAIADTEPATSEDSLFAGLLVEERDAMVQLLEHGASFKVILTLGPAEQLLAERPADAAHYLARLHHLDAFLERALGRREIVERLRIVRLPIAERNLLLLGNDYVFEGRRIRPVAGFDATSISGTPLEVRREVELYDILFEEGLKQVRRRHRVRAEGGNRALIELMRRQLGQEIGKLEQLPDGQA